MSKWLRKDDYDDFANQKAKEAENNKDDSSNHFFRKWKNPQMGTVDRAKEYKIRLLPDPVKGFYKEYMYHGFRVGEKFKYFLCNKTYGLEEYCPFCEATKILYQGNDTDKRKASQYKRNTRYVSNVYVIEDPRDVDVKDEAYKVNNTVRLYEFPSTVESKISNEINDKDQGYGMKIFDPEDGFDFILKVKAKPKDKNGKEWPDYGDTIFARRATPIAETEEKISEIMAQCISLEEYIKSLVLSVDEMETLLKSEMLWDDVGHNFEKCYKRGTSDTVMSSSDTKMSSESPVNANTTQESQASSNVAESNDNDQDDTDALLAELQKM